jgi:phage-related protein
MSTFPGTLEVCPQEGAFMEPSPRGYSAPLRIVYWSVPFDAPSPVEKMIKTFHSDVQASFDNKIRKVADNPEAHPGFEYLRYLPRFGEIKVNGAHGFHRFIARMERDYIVVLDAMKKKGNDTPTVVAKQRWNEWETELSRLKTSSPL